MSRPQGSGEKENPKWITESQRLHGYVMDLDEFIVTQEAEVVLDSTQSDEEIRKGSVAASIQGPIFSSQTTGDGTDRKKANPLSRSIGSVVSSPLHHNRSSINRPLPLEWYNFRNNSPMVGFDLELWWRRSPFSTRVLVFVALFLVVIAFINLVAGIVFIIMGLVNKQPNPYLCETTDCRGAAKWMMQTMNTSVNPCDNFYEFVCGKTEELSNEDVFFARYIITPGYKIEYGENSILAKILKNYKGNDDYDQPIKYYQACLNERNKQKHGLEAIADAVEFAFGSRDLTAFDSSGVELEEVAAKMFKVMGHAVYLTMGFYPYPYIQRMLPLEWCRDIYYDGIKNNRAEQPVTRIFEAIMPLFGFRKTSKIIRDASSTLRFMMYVIFRIEGAYASFHPSVHKKVITGYLGRAGFCPPMGINLNIDKIFELFLGDTFKPIYLTESTRVFAEVLQWCFNEDASKFTAIPLKTVEQPKLSLGIYLQYGGAAIWIFGLFVDMIGEMDENFINQLDLNRDSDFVSFDVYSNFDTRLETRCLESMWKNLGYLPMTRYIQSIMVDPMKFIEEKEREIRVIFGQVRESWENIPESQIWEHEHFIGKLLFGRNIHADVVIPVVGDVWDTSIDSLNLTNDPLRNAIIAVKYSVEKARQNWLGSTDSVASVKWWGDNGFTGHVTIRESLLDLQSPYILSPKFVERRNAAREGRWEKFLNRIPENYILFPYSLFNEPHTSETLWLENGGITFKIIRTILSLVLDSFLLAKYPQTYWEPPHDIENLGPLNVLGYYRNSTQNDYTCTSFDNPEPARISETPTSFNYALATNITLSDFSWVHDFEFFNTLAVKLTLKHFHEERKRLLELPFGWDWEEEARNQRMQRFLPGYLSKYTEDQLLLIALVRQNCRASWKKYEDHDSSKKHRYFLETLVLNMMMQAEEFADVWKCPSDSFLNLHRDKRCLNYVP